MYLFLAIFIISTAIHLYASYKKDQRLRNLTKPFILLALLGYYCVCANPVSVLIILALILSWLGDVLLIPKGVKWFVVGGISFMASHVFFILGYSKLFSFADVPLAWIFILGTVFAAAVCIIFSHLKQYLAKALFYPMFLYLLINGTMNCFALFRMISNFNAATLVTSIGALLFFISDSCLFFVRFNKKNQSHFKVMLTYSLGEFLIITGLIM